MGRRPALGRKEVLPRPSRAELAGLPVHLVVADYPETLQVMAGWGVDVSEVGAVALGEVADRERLAELHDCLEWREMCGSSASSSG